MRGNAHVRFGGRRRGNQRPKARTGALPPTLYIPFDPEAANLMFMLVSRRFERASMIVASNKNSLGRELRRRRFRGRHERPRPRPR